MKKYKKEYLKYHGLTQADWIGCAICGETAVDLHHCKGRGKYLNDPKFLLPLCRTCHTKAHKNEISKELLISKLKLK